MWYSNLFPQEVQDYLRDHDLNRAGPVVISILGFIAVCCVSRLVYLGVMHRTQNRNRQGFVDLQSINSGRSISTSRSYSALTDSTAPRSCSGYGATRRREYSTSSGHITGSNSTESTSMAWRHLEDAVTDGCSQSDVFSTEYEEDQGSQSIEEDSRGGAYQV